MPRFHGEVWEVRVVEREQTESCLAVRSATGWYVAAGETDWEGKVVVLVICVLETAAKCRRMV